MFIYMYVDWVEIYDFNHLFQLSAISKDDDDNLSKKRKREGYVQRFPNNSAKKEKITCRSIMFSMWRLNSDAGQFYEQIKNVHQ